MSDALRPGGPVEGEYTDSELPLDAELSKDEYAAVEEAVSYTHLTLPTKA